MNENVDPLAELRDIHLPAPPELWPPALGWWILAALLTALFCYGIYRTYQIWQKNAYRRHGLKELESLFTREHQNTELLADINDLLKRVALKCSPREEVAHLTGESWVAFLDSKMPGHQFTMGAGQVLIDGPYAKASVDINRVELQKVVKTWIQTHQVADHD